MIFVRYTIYDISDAKIGFFQYFGVGIGIMN